MSVREPQAVRQHIDALQHQVTDLSESAEHATRETSQQVTARVEQVSAAVSRQTDLASGAGQAADQAQKQWQAMKADLAAKMRDLHDRIERKRGEVSADIADDDATDAEDAAVDALDYASWAVGQAELTSLMQSTPAPGQTNGQQRPEPAEQARRLGRGTCQGSAGRTRVTAE